MVVAARAAPQVLLTRESPAAASCLRHVMALVEEPWQSIVAARKQAAGRRLVVLVVAVAAAAAAGVAAVATSRSTSKSSGAVVMEVRVEAMVAINCFTRVLEV